ncbi:MAG: efflux RND transporter periplasmic adaptor subunit [Thermodesulfobacteriota bacterium]
MRKAFVKFIFPILILALAVLVALAMVKGRKAPKRISPVSQGPMVETMAVKLVDLPVKIRATGTVAARRHVEIIPQVSGVVTKVSPNLVLGAFFKKGDLLLEIEQTDYVLALEQARADLSKAQLDFALIEGKAVIARREWQMLRKEETVPRPLVVYEPQLASAKATVASAKAKVKLAEVNLGRTRIKAPFNCFIRTKNVDFGQYLRAGTMILEVAGTDAAEIVVPLPLADLPWLDVPRQNNGKQGSQATISMAVGSEKFTWQGFLSRALGEVDAKTRMVDVVIVIDDPYLLQKKALHGRELALGSFVQVEVQGRVLPQVARIPRKALQGEDRVWLVDDKNQLVQREVVIARKEKESVLIDKGLIDGDLLVLTPVSGAANGLIVRLRGGGEKP